MSRLQKMIGILGFVSVLGIGIENTWADCPTPPSGFDCKCNGDDTKWVCAKYDGGGAPEEGSDFTVTYASGVPDVVLFTPDLGWELYSEVISTGAPADIDDITLSNSSGNDFEVTIANGAGAGAANVKKIYLNDTGFTGYSSIEGGSISGDLTGGFNSGLILVQDSGGKGGELTFTIGGDVASVIAVPVVKALTIDGALTNDLTVSDTIACGGSLTVDGIVGAAADIVIADTCNATIEFDSGTLGRTFSGDLTLESGVPSGTTVTFNGSISSGTTIDLESGGVAGTLECLNDNSATILNGGAVTWQVLLSSGSGHAFSGSATFASMTAGSIRTWNFADLDGSITVTGGTTGISDISVQGDLTSNGSITVNGTIGLSGSVDVIGNATGGDISIGKLEGAFLSMGAVTSSQTLVSVDDMVSSGATDSTVSMLGDFGGTLDLAAGIKADQAVVIYGELVSSGTIDLNSQAVAGTLTLKDGGAGTITGGGAVAGTVYLADGSADSYSGRATFDSVTSGNIRTANGGIMSGLLTITNNVANECVFTGLVSGDIVVGGSLSSAIDLSDDLSGDIQIDTGVTSSGDIRVRGSLNATGRILVDGLFDGDIKIHEETVALSQIVLSGGLDDFGSIEINKDGGEFDANGTIHVGPASLLGGPAVIFDGCIIVYDDGEGGGGDLRGAIVVVGCHNLGDLNICLDGGDGGENIDIRQTDCPNQVDWSCGTCP